MNYLVNILMPTRGMRMTVADYIATALGLGYNRFQALGSVGGSVTGGALTRNGCILTRI